MNADMVTGIGIGTIVTGILIPILTKIFVKMKENKSQIHQMENDTDS